MLLVAMKRGESLRDELERRFAAGGYFTVSEAVSAMAPLATSLAEHHEEGVALFVHPSSVRFGSNGCTVDLVGASKPPELERDVACVAPELAEDQPCDPRATVYAVAAMLYEMVTGEPVGPSMRPVSETAPEVTEAFEQLLDEALFSEVEARPSDLRALAEALEQAWTDDSASSSDDDSDDDEFDVDIESSASLLPPAHSPEPVRVPASERAPIAAPAKPAAPAPRPAATARGPRGATGQLAELKARLESDPQPRYLVVKDGMDHGPFTAVELLHQIATRHFLAEHPLVDSVTKEERPIEEWPDFAPFAEQAERGVAAAIERKDLEAQVSADTRSNRRKFYMAALVGVLGLGGLSALYFRFARAKSEDVVVRTGQAQNVDFEGELAKRKGGRAGGGRRGPFSAGGAKVPGGPGAAAGSDESANSDDAGEPRSDGAGTVHPVVPGGLSCEGAQARYVEDYSKDAPPDLSAGAYGAVLNRGDYLNACGVPPSMAVSICAAVQNGRAVGVSVSTTPSNGSIARCVSGQVRSLSFPSHPRLDVSRTAFAAQ